MWLLFIRVGNSPNPCKRPRGGAQKLGRGAIWPIGTYTPWGILPGDHGGFPGFFRTPVAIFGASRSFTGEYGFGTGNATGRTPRSG